MSIATPESRRALLSCGGRMKQFLLGGFKAFGVDKGMAVLMFVILDSEEQKAEMVEYMMEHLKATEEELVEEAYKIAGRQ